MKYPTNLLPVIHFFARLLLKYYDTEWICKNKDSQVQKTSLKPAHVII